MLVEFTPSRSTERASRIEHLREFRGRFVAPLGVPRKRVDFDGTRVVISLNASGAMSLVPTMLEVAANTLNELTFEAVVWDNVLGSWIGDLERGSLSLSIGRVGSSIDLTGGFRVDSSEYVNSGVPPIDENSSISVYVDPASTGAGIVRLKANAVALVGLAQHLAYISGAAGVPGAKISYTRESVKRFRGRPLVIQRVEFGPDDPWTAPSGKPLVTKLGIRSGDTVAFRGAPPGYRKILGPLPERVRIVNPESGDLDFVQVFVRSRGELREQLRDLRGRIKPTGMIWVSWPKQASSVATDLTETQVREIAIDARLVDVKVVAIDATWSGLKLVIRVKDRT